MLRFFQIISATIIYAVIIFSSVIMTQKAEIMHSKGKKRSFLLLSLIAIVIPCLLAGFRGETVGNDVLVYAEPVYHIAARTNTITSLLTFGTRYEMGYLVLAYISSHFFHSFNMMLFLTQFLIVAPIYAAAHNLKERVPAWSVMMCFYCFFYIATFNIMREGIAVGFVFLSFTEYLNKKILKAILFAFIGILFHNTAAIGIALILFVLWFRKLKSRQVKIFLLLVVTIFIPVIMSKWTSILTLLVNTGIIKSRYINYINYMQGEKSYFTFLGTNNYIELVFRWLGFFIPLFFYKHDKNETFQYLIMMGVLLSTLIYTSVFISLHSSYGYRVSFYLEIMFCVWMSTLTSNRKYISPRKIPLKIAMLFLSSFTCFFIGYMWRGFHGTFPLYFQIYRF